MRRKKSKGHDKSDKDCPEPKETTGGCFNCDEERHNKSECTTLRVEREFSGTCDLCGEAGHRRAERPQKGPDTCRACGKEGTAHWRCIFSLRNADVPRRPTRRRVLRQPSLLRLQALAGDTRYSMSGALLKTLDTDSEHDNMGDG